MTARNGLAWSMGPPVRTHNDKKRQKPSGFLALLFCSTILLAFDPRPE
jgi:hypothetical protein